MKKLTTLLFVILSLNVVSQVKQGFGMEFLTSNKYKLSETNTCSYNGNEFKEEDYKIFDKGDYCFKYKLTFNFKNFELKSLTNIFMTKGHSIYSFSPCHSEFKLSLKYTYKKISFKLEHLCVHPIITDSENPRSQLKGGYSSIGVYWNW